MSMVVACGRSLGYTSAAWRRDRDRPLEGTSEVFWFEGNYEAYKEDLRKRKRIDADQPHRVAHKALVRA